MLVWWCFFFFFWLFKRGQSWKKSQVLCKAVWISDFHWGWKEFLNSPRADGLPAAGGASWSNMWLLMTPQHLVNLTFSFTCHYAASCGCASSCHIESKLHIFGRGTHAPPSWMVMLPMAGSSPPPRRWEVSWQEFSFSVIQKDGHPSRRGSFGLF